MVFNWSAGWVGNSAIPILYSEIGKPLMDDRDRKSHDLHNSRLKNNEYTIPDVMKYFTKLSLSEKAASIIGRWEPRIVFTPKVRAAVQKSATVAAE